MTFEEAVSCVKDFVSEFGVPPDSHQRAVEILAQSCVNDDVSELFQRLAIAASFNAFNDEEKKQGMFMGMSHILNELSLVFRPSDANRAGSVPPKVGF